MKHKHGIRGTSMVEMLAVMSVILILLGTYAANTVRTRSMGDIATMRTQAAAVQLAMSTALATDINEQDNWSAISAANPGSPADNDRARNEALFNSIIIKYLNRPGARFDVFMKPFEGYRLQLPASIGGRVIVTDPIENTTLYPVMPAMN